jgi:hypothetical protein
MNVRQAQIVGMCALAALALSALAAGTAWGAGQPVVTRVLPQTGALGGGTPLLIVGKNLEDASAVTFGSNPASSFVAKGQQQPVLEAISPPGGGSVDITVTTNEGTSATSAADRFAYREVTPEFGEITGPATIGLGGLKLTGCQGRTLGDCRGSGAAAGEIQTGALDGQLGITSVDSNPTKDTVAVELSPASGEAIAELSCGASPITVRGALMLALGTANRMKSKTIWKGVEHKGVQKLMQFVGGSPVKLEAKIGAGAYEQTGLKLPDGEEEVDVEFNAVF